MSDTGGADKSEAPASPGAARQEVTDVTEATASKSPSAVRSPSLHRSHSRASHRRSHRRDRDHATTASPTPRTTAASSSSQTPRGETKQKRASKAPSVEDAPPALLPGEQSVLAKQPMALARSPVARTVGWGERASTAPADPTSISAIASLSPNPPVPPDQAKQASRAVYQPAPPRESTARPNVLQDSPVAEVSHPARMELVPSSPALKSALSASMVASSPMVHSFWSMFSSNEYQMTYMGKRSEYLVCMVCGVFAAGLILVSFLLAAHLTVHPDYVVVQGPFGAVRGVAITAEGGRRVQAFYGIPFAKEPVGELRFARPQPPEPGYWEVSHKRQTACPQPRLGNVGLGTRWVTDEDCLRLNIWMPVGCVPPETPRCDNKTVLVFLTGSLFQKGDAGGVSGDGSLLAALGDVAVVTITYRLGALGFLCVSEERDAGNMGLYDQLEAMAWVRKYIAYFGGNGSEITVVGHGSGAVSLGYHMLNRNSGWAHSINRFIVMSNSPYNRQIDSRAEAMNKTASLSKELACGDLMDDPKFALDCLQDVNVTVLLDASSPTGERVTNLFFPMHGNDLVPVRPSLQSRVVSIEDKKVLIGYTASAGAYHAALLAHTQSKYEFETSVAKYAVHMLQWLGVPDAEEVVAVYGYPTTPEMDMAWLRRVFGGVLNVCPVRYFAEHLAREKKNAVYSYVMNRTLSYEQHDQGGNEPLTRIEDLEFLFGLPRSDRPASEDDAAYSRSLIAIWTNFAKTGHLPLVQGQQWPQFDPQHRETVVLSGPEPLLLRDIWKNECDELRERLM